MGNVVISTEDLQTSARKYRSELLTMPVHRLANTLAHMTLRTGIRHSETVGELTGSIEFGPYSETRIDKDDVNITPRILKTYLGSVVKEFSPNSVYQSIYGSSITKGEGLKTVEITRQVLAFLSAKLGAGIDAVIFKAKRNDSGTKTIDLFDGFDTIIEREITATKLTTALGNLYEFSDAIDNTNAVDLLKTFCRSANDFLKEQQGAELIVSHDIYDAYIDDYKNTTGAIIYNEKFLQTSVEGFQNIKIVPMYQKSGSKFIHLSTKSNLLVGVDQQSQEENITVEKHAAFVLQFIATMFFGVEFESIAPERLLIGKLAS